MKDSLEHSITQKNQIQVLKETQLRQTQNLPLKVNKEESSF